MKRKSLRIGTMLATTIFAPGLALAQVGPVVTPTAEELAARITQLENQRTGQGLSLGPNTTLTLYGFVQFQAFQDLDFIQNDLTNVRSIGDPGLATNGNFDTSVRVSRLGVRTATETGIGTIGTQLEYDLFGGGSESSPTLRLRHANVTIGDAWLLGQFWTNFMPIGEYPTTLDFNGPVGITFARTPQVRYSNGFGDVSYSFSVEENVSNSEDPVFTAAASYGTDRFTVRGAVLGGTAQSGDDEVDQFGLTLSGTVRPWDGGEFTATYVTGEAIGSYMIGGGADIVDGQANDVDGFTLEYRQRIAERYTLGVAYGRESYDQATSFGLVGGDTSDFDELESIHLNAGFTPVENLTLGLEYSRIERTTSSNESFDGDRIEFQARYSF